MSECMVTVLTVVRTPILPPKRGYSKCFYIVHISTILHLALFRRLPNPGVFVSPEIQNAAQYANYSPNFCVPTHL